MADTMRDGARRASSRALPAIPSGAISLIVGLCATAALRLVLGLPSLTFDSACALAWGREIATGQFSGYYIGGAPHFLPDLIGTLASLTGNHGPALFELVTLAAYGALVAGVLRAGRLAFSLPAGIWSALVIGASVPILYYSSIAFSDVTAAALVVWALALELERPRRGTAVLVLLAIAGLDRPETWALSVLYWIYLLPSLEGRRRFGLAALALAAPIVWMASDLILVGDPLFAFTSDPNASSTLGAAVPLRRLPGTLVSFERHMLGLAPLALGIAGAVLVAYRRERRPAIVLAVGLVWGGLIFAEGVDGILIYDRFVIVPAAALAILAGYATLGWAGTRIGSGGATSTETGRLRTAWTVAGTACAVLVLALLPGQISQAVARARSNVAQRRLEGALAALGAEPRVRRAAQACTAFYAPSGVLPYVAYYWHVPLAEMRIDDDGAVGDGTFLGVSSRRTLAAITLPPGIHPPRRPPSGFTYLAGDGGLTVFVAARCR
jgi:hypothetical protein